MKRIIRVRDELALNGSHADAIRAVQKILSDELERIENKAWELYGVARTPEAVEKIGAWIIEYGAPGERLGISGVRPKDHLLSAELEPLFFAISMCRKEIDRWLVPEIAVAFLLHAKCILTLALSDKDMPTVADIMSRFGKRGAHLRHTKNREKAEAIKAWYRENSTKYRSMDAAAEAVADILGVSFRTARKHVGEEARELRSGRRV